MPWEPDRIKLVSREPDRRTVVEKNPDWWDKPLHNLDRVEFDVIASAPTRVAALLSGEVDMIYTVPPQDIARIRQTDGLKILETPELRTIYLGFNQSARRAAEFRHQGQESVQGCERAAGGAHWPSTSRPSPAE